MSLRQLPHLTLTTRQVSADYIGRPFNKFGKKCQIVEFHYHIRNRLKKCIKISTNMPGGIGLVIPEITCEMLEF